jgi:nitrate/nitrite transporter NarK
MAATARMIPPAKRGMATGIVNAGGSFGQFLMAQIAGALMVGIGWAGAMQVLGLIVLLALPAAFLLKGSAQASASPAAATAAQKPLSTKAAIMQAPRDPSYLMLAGGFFVCGFRVAFFWAPICPAWWPLAGFPPSGVLGRWACWGCSISWVAWPWAGRWAAGA